MKRAIWEGFKEPRWKATFLIVCAGVIFKLSPVWIALILIGYSICDDIDRRLVRRARWEAIEYDICDWKSVTDGSNEVLGRVQ